MVRDPYHFRRAHRGAQDALRLAQEPVHAHRRAYRARAPARHRGGGPPLGDVAFGILGLHDATAVDLSRAQKLACEVPRDGTYGDGCVSSNLLRCDEIHVRVLLLAGLGWLGLARHRIYSAWPADGFSRGVADIASVCSRPMRPVHRCDVADIVSTRRSHP